MQNLDAMPVWVRRAPPWVLSGVFHLILALIATVLVFTEAPAEAREVQIQPAARERVDWEDRTLPPRFVKRPKVPLPDIRETPRVVLDPEELVVEIAKGDPEEITDKFIEHDVGLRDPFGIGGRPVGHAGLPDGMEGRERERGSLGGHVPQLELGQEWLAKHQSKDGSWKCAGFQEECDGNKCSGTGFAGYDVGVTALAVLAFTGVGNTPWHGKHRKVVRKAVRWLISQQEKDGAIGRSEAEGWMYNHAIATMALCEVRAMAGAHRHTLIRPTQAAVNFCLRAQNPGLAWRYESRSGDNDTSVTGWMLLALKAARMADIEVPDETFRSARAFLDRVTHSTGIAGYRGMDGESSYLAMQEGMYEAIPTMTAVSVLCRRLTGQSKKDSKIREGVSVLLESLPDPAGRLVNHYYWYYGTYALFQASRGPHDPRWKKWHRAVIKALIPAQNTDSAVGEAGSWAPTGEWGIAGGRVYSTAINLLTLEATFRYERMD